MAQPRTNILEPITHTNKKTSFRVQSGNRVIYSNLRLVDFGLSSVAGQTGQECFAFGSGAYALIKNVRLYSGNTLLDQCLDCDRIMGHHMLRGSTMDKFDLDQPLVGNSLNIRLNQTDIVNAVYETALQPLANKLLARIKLDDVLPLLKSLDYGVRDFIDPTQTLINLKTKSDLELPILISGADNMTARDGEIELLRGEGWQMPDEPYESGWKVLNNF